jgi:hypothetical protein
MRGLPPEIQTETLPTCRALSQASRLTFVVVTGIQAVLSPGFGSAVVTSRNELSNPPAHFELLAQVVEDAFARSAVGTVVSAAAVLREVAPQLPQDIPLDQIVRAIGEAAIRRGLALEFDAA